MSDDDDSDGIDRRQLLKLTGVTATTPALAGCDVAQERVSDLVEGADEAYEEFEARPAGFDERGAVALGLAGMETTSYDTRREPTVDGETYLVDETHKITTYGDDARYRLGVLSTPQAEIDDTRTNPVADQDLGSFLSGQHGKRLLEEMGVHNNWINGPRRIDRLERQHLMNNLWPIEVYAGEFPTDQGLVSRHVAVIRAVDYLGSDVVVAVCTGTDPASEWERARAILNMGGWTVGFEPSWSGARLPSIDISDLRPVQTVENSAGSPPVYMEDPPVVADEPAALVFTLDNDSSSPDLPDYLRARIVLEREQRERIEREYDIRGQEEDYGNDVKSLLDDVSESIVFQKAAEEGTWGYGSTSWGIAPPLMELSPKNREISLELLTPVGNRVARREIEADEDFEVNGVPTLRVAFIEVQHAGADENIDIDWGDANGRAKNYERSVRSSFEFLQRVFPGKVVAYRHDIPMLAHDREEHDDADSKDARKARQVLNYYRNWPAFPLHGTVLNEDFSEQAALDLFTGDESGMFDARVMILPRGTASGNTNYYVARGEDNLAGLYQGRKKALGSLEARASGDDLWHGSVSAQEIGHRFVSTLYDGPYARWDADEEKDDPWHIQGEVSSVGYDFTDGSFRLVTGPEITDGSFELDPAPQRNPETYDSYMSYGEPPFWADSMTHRALIDGQFDPTYTPPSNASGEGGAGSAQSDEAGSYRDSIQPVIEAFGTIEDGTVRFDAAAVYDTAPEDHDGGTYDADRYPEATPVDVALLDPNDEVLREATVPDRERHTHGDETSESVSVSLPFPDSGVSLVARRDGVDTGLNPVVAPLRDLLERVPDRGTVAGVETLPALQETLDEVDALMDGGAYGDAAQLLDGPFREGVRTEVREEYDRFAGEPRVEELVDLTERMIERLNRLGENQQGQRLACGTTIPPRISEDTVLQEGCTYTIPERKRGTVRVFEGATLTIEPGVEIEVAAGSSITVREDGTLTARGTEDDPIEIHGSSEEPGHWQGIEIYSDDPANELTHVTVAHAGDVYWNSAVVMHRTDAARATIRNCTIQESSSSGIKVDAGGELVDFRNNRIENCQGPPLWLNPDLLTSLTGTTTVANNGQSHILVDSDIGSLNPAAKTDGTWPAMEVPYEFNKGASITAQIDIEAGATLQFRGDNRPGLSVEDGGRLVADASDGDPVTFTGDEDAPGTWRGIFVSTTTDNLLRNVVVSDGGGGYRNANVGVGTEGTGTLTLEDSTISDSAGWGVRVTADGTLTESNNTYRNNAEGAVRRSDG